MSSSRVFKTFLPSIPKQVSRKTIIDNFNEMKIGKVFYIEKVDKKKKDDSVAFVYLTLYETEQAKKWENEVVNEGCSDIVYDKKTGLAWKTYLYLNREQRKEFTQPVSKKTKKPKKNVEEFNEIIVYKPAPVPARVPEPRPVPVQASKCAEPNDTIVYVPRVLRADTQAEYEELSKEIFVESKKDLEKLAFYEMWDGMCLDFGLNKPSKPTKISYY
jgi:hypothetical protein